MLILLMNMVWYGYGSLAVLGLHRTPGQLSAARLHACIIPVLAYTDVMGTLV